MLGVSFALALGLLWLYQLCPSAFCCFILVGFTVYLYTSARSDDTAEAEAGVDENLVPGGLPVGRAGAAGRYCRHYLGRGFDGRWRGRVGAPVRHLGSRYRLSLVAIGTSLPELGRIHGRRHARSCGAGGRQYYRQQYFQYSADFGCDGGDWPLPISSAMAMRDMTNYGRCGLPGLVIHGVGSAHVA